MQRKIWPYEPTVLITISLFRGGPVVWTPEGPNLKFWESEKAKSKSMEELQANEEVPHDMVEKEEALPILPQVQEVQVTTHEPLYTPKGEALLQKLQVQRLQLEG